MADRFEARAAWRPPRSVRRSGDDGRDLAGLRRIPGEDGARDPRRHHRARPRDEGSVDAMCYM